MGWREGIEMGLSLSNAYNRDKQQSAELAQANLRQMREKNLWEVMNQTGQDTQDQIGQARARNGLSGADIGLAAPLRDPRVLRQGGYVEEHSQAQPEQLSFGPAYEQSLGRLQQKAKLAQAAGDSNALLGVQDELRKLQMDAGSAAIKHHMANASTEELGMLTKTISDNKQNNWKMQVDPKTGITTVSNGGESVVMSRDQLAGLVAARWRLKQGDPTASDDIAKIHKSFVDENKVGLETLRGVAQTNNTAATARNQILLGNSAEARAQTQFNDGATAREASKQEAGLRLELARLDDTTPEGKQRSEQIQSKLLALKTGQRGSMAGHDPADVIKAKKLFMDGKYGSEAEAIDAVINKPDKMFQEFQKVATKDSAGNIDRANKVAGKLMEANGWVRNQSGTWRRSGVTSAPVAEFGSVADAEAAAKAGKLKPGDEVKIGGRTATYQR